MTLQNLKMGHFWVILDQTDEGYWVSGSDVRYTSLVSGSLGVTRCDPVATLICNT